MKKLIFGTFLVLNITLAYSADKTDVTNLPSGHYIDFDVHNGLNQPGMHSQLMNKQQYKQHLLFAVDHIQSVFCSEDKFATMAERLKNPNPFMQTMVDRNNEEVAFCDEIETWSIRSDEKKLKIIDKYKQFVCNRNVDPKYAPQFNGIDEGFKASYLSNCLSNPKELTMKEYYDFTHKIKQIESDGMAPNVLDSALGTLPPMNGAGGFNFGSGGSNPAAAVWNFEESKEDELLLDDSLVPESEESPAGTGGAFAF